MQSMITYCSKLGNTTHNLSLAMEEQSRKSSLSGKIISILLTKTLADKQFPKFFKLLLFNPLYTALGLLLLYIVFCILFFPLFLFSYVLTTSGSVMLLLFLIALGARSFARLMTFPGSSSSVARDMSSDMMRRLSLQYENLSSITNGFVSTLAMLLSGRVARFDVDLIVNKFRELQATVTSFQSMTESLNEAVKSCTDADQEDPVPPNNNHNGTSTHMPKSTKLKPQEIVGLQVAMFSIDQFHRAFSTFDPLVGAFCAKLQNSTSIADFSSSKRMGSSSSTQAFNPATLITREELSALLNAITSLAKACDELRAQVGAHLRPQVNGEKDFVTSIITSVLQLNQGPSGVELLAFPFMRQQVRRGYKAEELHLTGSDGQLMDAIFVPSKYAPLGPRNRNGMSDPTDQSRGTVIFCCPNAGLYECIAMSIGLPCSWNSFYYSLGFNLVYFNYRGYGRSAGVPTPARVKGDAERVIECVQREWPSHRILVHGESLGGMVACHLARKYKIDLLVCDRTFASLDGVANRMLGTWAGLGLKYLGFWFTNVVSDYLAADCHKVILQDPKDEIIAFPASLRSGVSSFLTLRDSQWSIRSVPHSFQVSLALFNQKLSLKLNVETSNSLLSSQFLSSPILSLSPSIFKQSPSEMLEPLRNAVSGSFTIQSDVWSIISEDLIGYLFACLSAANLQFRAIAMYRKQSRNRSPQLGRRKESTGVTSDLNELHFPTPKRAGKIVLSSLQEEEAPSETNRLLDRDISNGKNSSLPTSALDTTVRSEANSFSSSSRASSGDRSSSGSSSSGVDIDTTQDNAYLNIADGIGLDLNGGDVTTTDESLLADQELYARHYQSFNTNDPYLHPVEKLWFILTRIDLNDGQALGPAFKRGYDTFRVWLTNALVWNTQYRPADISTRTGTGSKMSTPNSHRSGNGCNSKGIQVDSSLSVNQYLEVYRVIYTEFAASVDSIDSVESIDILMRREDIRLCDMLFFILEAFSLVTAYCTAAKVNMGSNGSLLDVEQGVSSGVGVDVDKDTIASTPSSYQHGSGNSSRNIGHTITLSTGHSGWPSEVELNTLRGEMRLAGFHV